MSIEYMDTEAWQTITNDIETKIIIGEYRAGERLPSIRTLVEHYRLSQWTVQRALERLAKEGILVMNRGKGYFVKPLVQNDLLNKRRKKLQKIIMDALIAGERVGFSEEELLAPYHKHRLKTAED